MPGLIASVVIASAQSVAKVYVIGAVGACAVHFPRRNPLLPSKSVGVVARFGFHVLVLSLIYSTIAQSVTASSIGSYWFIIVSAFGVLSISFLAATALGYVIGIRNPIDFASLRVSATFPNIVALPILIFPSLCEFDVVHSAFATKEGTPDDMYRECVDQSNTMVFCYFFMWSFLFWSFGYRSLMTAAHQRRSATIHGEDNNSSQDFDRDGDGEGQDGMHVLMWRALRQTLTSPGLIAMTLGFFTACIPPLQKALFEPGGALRFIGAATEALGKASSPMSTMVVAASLAGSHNRNSAHSEEDRAEGQEETTEGDPIVPETAAVVSNSPPPIDDVNNGAQSEPVLLSDPNFGPWQRRRSSVMKMRKAIRTRSSRALERFERPSPDMMRLHIWFILSRLVISPALVCAVLLGLQCSGLLGDVPNLAKLVVIINAALPGALVVVVLLKANSELADSAAVVAKVYLPSYLLSIFTIAAWSAVGLVVAIPTDNGKAFCFR